MALNEVDKRQFNRVKTQAALRYQVRGGETYNNAVCDNISAGGMSFMSERFIPRFTPLMLEVNILSKVLNPVGKVTWATSLPHSDKYRLGVEFVEMDPKEKEFISDYVDLQLNIL